MNLRATVKGVTGGYQHIISPDMISHGLPNVTKSAGATVTLKEEESGHVILQAYAGATTFTLPALKRGLWFLFVSTVDQNMIISSGATNHIIGVNGASFHTLTYSTTSQKIGAAALFYCTGAAWVGINISVGCAGTFAT